MSGSTMASPANTSYFLQRTVVEVLRVGDAWLVSVGKRAPHGFWCLWLVSPHGSLDRLKAYTLFPLH